MTDWEYVLEGAAMHGKLHEVSKRKWVTLTDEEILKLFDGHDDEVMFHFREFARAIEAKLKEKNT